MKRRIVDLLIEQAKKSTVLQKHGAAIVGGRRIFSYGYNKHVLRREYKSYMTIHAEVDAYYNIPCIFRQNLCDVDLYIIRIKETEDGVILLKNSKPCKQCLNFILRKGIKTVYYSNDEGEIVKESANCIYTDHICGGSSFRIWQ